MRRHVLTFVSALSAVLCATVIVMCTISYGNNGVGFHLPWLRKADYVMGVGHGKIVFRKTVELRPPPEATTMQWVRSRPMNHKNFLGFEYAEGEDVPYVDLFSQGRASFVHMYVRVHYVIIPAWAVVGLLMSSPLMWFRRHSWHRLIARRIIEGRCAVVRVRPSRILGSLPRVWD